MGARQEVSQALLRADCFPAGMELFPAADEEQFEFIKQVIDQSDYYIIITAGRYGSIHPEKGLSYTELEYDYAVETGKPVIRLLHKDPFNKLAGAFIEQTDEGRKKLRSFREKLSQSAMVNFWEEPKELGQLVVFGLMDARKRKPAVGWVRADGRASEEAEIEIANLKQRIAELELQIEKSKVRDVDYDALLDEYNQIFRFDFEYKEFDKDFKEDAIELSEKEIMKSICISLFDVSEEHDIDKECRKMIRDAGINLPYGKLSSFDLTTKSKGLVSACLHKLAAQGVIFSQKENRAVSHSEAPLVIVTWHLSEGARRWVSGLLAERTSAK